MATYTAGDQINRALRLLGVLAEGETPSASESNDALMALNQMLDSWSTERLSIYSTTDQVKTWPAGQMKRTLGPTGDLVGSRPILVDDSSYYVVNGISYDLSLVNQEQYNTIALKTATTTLPLYMFVNQTFPDVEIHLYPVPTQDLTMHFVSVEPLSQPAMLNTVLAFPPGYMRAFAYNLAVELAPEFGIEPPPQVRRTAVASKRDLKRINDPLDVLPMPVSSVGPGFFNILTGDY